MFRIKPKFWFCARFIVLIQNLQEQLAAAQYKGQKLTQEADDLKRQKVSIYMELRVKKKGQRSAQRSTNLTRRPVISRDKRLVPGVEGKNKGQRTL